MKNHLTAFTVFAILIVSISMTPAFGQSPITVTTDKESYQEGDTAVISGTVSQIISSNQVTMRIVAPLFGNLVQIDQLDVTANKTFSETLTIGGKLMTGAGTYTIYVQYGADRSAETSFEYGGNEVIIVPPTDVDPNDISGLIGFDITGGEVLSIVANTDDNSLIINIKTTSEDGGTLTMNIPREVFDAKNENGDDIPIFVIIDGEELADVTDEATEDSRSIAINFASGAEEIKLIGTHVIPEFGIIAIMVLAIAIISIVAISAKSRLSIIPRY